MSTLRRILQHTAASVGRINPYAWLWESLESDTAFLITSMFGGRFLYLDGKLMHYFSVKDEPRRGLLVCTDKTRHGIALNDFPMLSPHPVLSKWLYLREKVEAFEVIAGQHVSLTAKRDPRIGVEPKPRKKPSGKKIHP